MLKIHTKISYLKYDNPTGQSGKTNHFDTCDLQLNSSKHNNCVAVIFASTTTRGSVLSIHTEKVSNERGFSYDN